MILVVLFLARKKELLVMNNKRKKHDLVHQIVRVSQRKNIPSLLAYVLIMLFATASVLFFANMSLHKQIIESPEPIYRASVAGDIIIRTFPLKCDGWENSNPAKDIDLLSSSSVDDFTDKNSSFYVNNPLRDLGDVAQYELANSKLLCSGFQLAENIPPEAIEISGTVTFSFAADTYEGNEDIVVFSYSLDGGENWTALDSFALLDEMSNEIKEGYWSYPVTDLARVLNNDSFLVRVEYISEPTEDVTTTYLDGIALDIQYFEEKRVSGESEEILISGKKGMTSQTTPVATVEIEKDSTFKFLGVPTKKREVKSVQLIHPDGSVAEPETRVEKKEGKDALQEEYHIQKDNFDEPGVYKATFAIEEDGVIEEKTEEFAWGVLSLNTSKSVYRPGETANLSINAYNAEGDFVCDADISIQVTNPKGKTSTLTTTNGEISRSPNCGPKIVVMTADYVTSIEKLIAGNYSLTITGIIDGESYNITESLFVDKNAPFDITRIGPSRVYPIAEYEMFLEVIPKDDYFGTVSEWVPNLIEVLEIGEEGTIRSSDEVNNIISWQVDWKKGKAYTLSYKFESPTLVDYHFQLGPANFVDYRKEDKDPDPLAEVSGWKEQRPWLIESDSIADKDHESYSDDSTLNRIEVVNKKELRYRNKNGEFDHRFFPEDNFYQDSSDNWQTIDTQLDIISQGDSKVAFNVNGRPFVLRPAIVIDGVTQPVDMLSPDVRSQLQMRLEVQKVDQGNKWSHIFFRLPEIEAIEFLIESDNHIVTNPDATSLIIDEQLLLNFSDLTESGFNVSITPTKIKVTGLNDGWNILDPTDTFYSTAAVDGDISYSTSYFVDSTSTTSGISDTDAISPNSETRSYLSFDTASLDDSATVSAADVNTYAHSFTKSKGMDTTFPVHYYSGQDAIGATLTSADWGVCSTSHGTLDWANTTGWKSKSLTSPASAVNLTGDTDFRLIENFTVTTGQLKTATMRQTEYADTTSDPYLDVTYTTGISVSGNAYNENSAVALTECDGSTDMINLRVQSTTYQTTCADADGAFTFTGVSTPTGVEAMIIWIEGQTPNGATVNQYSSGDVTGMTVQENSVTIHNDSGLEVVSNADLDTYDNGNDDDINYTVTTNNLTIEDGHRLLIKTNENLTAGGTITTSSAATQSAMDGDIYMETGATLSMSTNALSIGGDFTTAGTVNFSVGTGQTTTFTGTTTGFSVEAEDAFNNITFNGSGGEWTFDAGATINLTMTVTAGEIILGGTTTVTNDVIINGGTLDVSGSNHALTLKGSWDIDSGNFQSQAGTVTFDDSIATETIDADGTGTDAFYNLTFDDGGTATEWDLTGALDVDNNLSITAGTLDNSSGSYAINIGGGWDNDDTYTRGTETITFDAASGTHSIDADGTGAQDLYHVVFDDGGGTATWQLTANFLWVDGNMTLTDGIFDLNNYYWYSLGNLNKTGGTIEMDQASDAMIFRGTFTISGADGTNNFTDGSIQVWDDVNISGDNTFVFGGAGTPRFYFSGALDPTISMSGLNNQMGSSSSSSYFDTSLTGSTNTVTFLTDINAAHCRSYEGIWVINGQNFRCDGVYYGYNGSGITMATGSMIVGRESYSGGTYSPWYSESGWTENISGGTIQVYGSEHATYGTAYFADGSNFTPTGGTFQLVGTATASIYVAETDVADFNFWNLTIGDSSTKTVEIDTSSITAIDIDGNLIISANDTFDSNAEPIEVAGNWDNNGTYTHDSNTITFDAVDGDNTIEAGSDDYNNVTFSGAAAGNGTWTVQTDDMSIAGTIDVDTGDTLTIGAGRTATWTGGGFTLDGTVSGDGRLTVDTATAIPTTGTLSSVLRVHTSGRAGMIVPARAYGDDVELYNSSPIAARSIIFAAGTYTISGGLYLYADDSNNITANISDNEPAVTVSGDVDFLGIGGGSELIDPGSATLTVGGNIDLTGGDFVSAGGATLKMNGTSKTITSGSDIIGNYEVSAGSVSNTDVMDVDGTFDVSAGTFAHGAADINLSGNLTIANGASWTAAASNTLILDGDLTWTDNNATPVEVSAVQIGASPDTTDLASDIAAKGVTVTAGNFFYTNGYDMTLGGYGLSVSGTFDATDDVETDETFITTDGDVTFASGSAVTIDQSTITFDAASGTDNIFNGGTQDLYNLVINGTVTVEVEDAIDVNGDLTITSGTLDVVSGENNSINLAGSWDNDATFEARSGTVTFDAASGTHTIDADGTGTDTFYDITFNDSAGSAEWDLTGALDVANDLAIVGGTLDNSATSYSINIGGGWDNDDTYTRGTETTTFDGTSGTHNIDADGTGDDDFYHVVINDSAGSAHWDLTTQPMQIDGNLTITDGELDLNNYDSAVTGSISKTGGALVLDQSSSQVVVNGNVTITGSDAGAYTQTDGVFNVGGNFSVSNDDSYKCATSGSWAMLSMIGSGTTTFSMSGANNDLGDATNQCMFYVSKTGSSDTAQLITDVTGARVYHNNGYFDINGQTATFVDRYQVASGGGIRMATGTLKVGRNGFDGGNRAPLHLFSGSVEDITGGTIEIYGTAHATYGTFGMDNGANFTPTGGAVKFLGTDATNTLYTTEVGAADFNLYNLEIGDGSNAKTFNINTIATIPVDINGSLTINANGTFDTNTEPVEVAGSWTNNGTFTADSGAVTLDGAATQTISGTLTGASSFYDLTITNSSGSYTGCDTAFTPGVDFAGSATSTNNYTVTTANAKVEYNSGSTYTFTNINWVGTSGNEVIFRNSNLTSGTWLLNVSGTQTAVSYVSVARSDASSGNQIEASDGTNTDCGNNTNWFFYTFTVAGNVYNENTTTALTECDGVTENVALRVNSVTYTTSCNDSTGAYTFTNVADPSTDDPMITWIDGETPDGTTVNKYSGSGDVTGKIVEESALTIHNDSVVAISNTDLDTYDNGDDADINYTVTTGALTTEDTHRIIIKTNENFTPAGTVTTSPAAAVADMDGDIYLETGATLNMATNALSVGGDYSTAGTVTLTLTGGQNTTFTATAGTTYSVEAEDAWQNLVFNGGSETDWGFDAAATVNGNLTVTSGEINLSGTSVIGGDVGIAANGALDSVKFQNHDFSVGGSWDNDGDFDCWACQVTFNAGSGTETIESDAPSTDIFWDLVFDDSGGSATWQVTSTMDVDGGLTITGGTLDANGSNIYVGKNWDNDDTFTHSNATVLFDGEVASSYLIDADGTGTDSFYNVTVGGNSSAIWVMNTDMDVDNDLIISTSELSLGTGNTLYVGGDFTNNNRFTESTGTLTMNGGAGTHWIDTSEAESVEYADFYNLTFDDGAAGATYKSYYPIDADNNITVTGGDLNMNGPQTWYLTSDTTDAVADNRRLKVQDPAGTADNTSTCDDNATNQGNKHCILLPTSSSITWISALPSTIQQRGYMLNNGQAINGTFATGDWTANVTTNVVEGKWQYAAYRIYGRLWKASTALGSATAISDWSILTNVAVGVSDNTITFSDVAETTLSDEVLYIEFATNFKATAFDAGSGSTTLTLRVNEGGAKQKVNSTSFAPQINVGGNWDNDDTFTHANNTVVFDPASGTKTINSTGATDDDFYDVIVNDGGGTGTVQLAGTNIQVDGDLTIEDGTYDINNLQTLVTGSFSKTGGNINMDQASDHINVDGDFTVSGDGGASALQDGSIVVAGDVAISNDNVFQMGNSVGYPVFSMDGAVSKGISVSGTGNYFGTSGATGEFDIDKTGGAVVNVNSSVDIWNLVHNTGGLNIDGAYTVDADGQYAGLGGTLTMSNGTLSLGSDDLAPSSYSIFYVASGWTEAISGGTIEVDGIGHATNEAAYFADGSVFTPTGGTFKFIGNDNATFEVAETGAADFNFYDLTIGDGANTKTVDIDAVATIPIEVINDVFIAANGTFDTNSEPVEVGNDWDNDGTFTADSGIVTFDASDTDNIISAGTGAFNDITFQGGDGSGTWTFLNDNATISGAIDVDIDDTVSIFSGYSVTWTGASFTLDGTISGSTGRLIVDSSTTIPTTGTLTCITQFNATNGNTTTMPARDYGAVEIYSFSGTDRSITPLSGTHNIAGNFTLAAGTNNTSFSGAANDPIMNITGTISFTESLGGASRIYSGAAKWTVGGNIDLTGGTLTTETGNIFAIYSGGSTITSSANDFLNVEVDSGGIIGHADALDINGTLTVESGGGFTQATSWDVYVAGDFTLENSSTFTAASGSGKLYLDGDLTLTDNNGTKQDLGDLYIGTSPDTTDLASDAAAKGVTVGSGDVLNTNGYELTIGSYGLNVIGTLDMTDDVETDETFITTDGDVTFASGSSVTEDQSTITFDAASDTDNIFNPGDQDFYNLVINGAALTVEVEEPIDVDGDLTITNGILDVVTGEDNQINVAGNWTNNGTFTARSGAVVFDGASTQTLSGTMTSTSAFNDLTVTNNSGSYSGCDSTFTPGIDFAAAATINGTYTITTADSKIEYNSGSTYTVNNINWDGGAYNDEIIFRNSNLSLGEWDLDVSGTQTAVKYVNVARSNADSGDVIDARHISNVDCSVNTFWLFDSITLSISDTTIGFGDLTSANARYANEASTGSDSKVSAHTITVNTAADNGYILTYNGPLLTSGSDTISAATITNDDDGTPGTEQFGLGITTAGDCTIASEYTAATPAEYKFVASTTTTICSETGPTTDEVISAYYISNIGSETEAGSYSTDITYIMTATF